MAFLQLDANVYGMSDGMASFYNGLLTRETFVFEISADLQLIFADAACHLMVGLEVLEKHKLVCASHAAELMRVEKCKGGIGFFDEDDDDKLQAAFPEVNEQDKERLTEQILDKWWKKTDART